MRDIIKQWFWNILSSDLANDNDLEALRKIILTNIIVTLGIFFLALIGTLVNYM